MLSCDTIAVCAEHSVYAQNILAKNSDRPTGEAQPLCIFPGGSHEEGEMLQMTHLTIPQAAQTYTVIGSKPYWIWGFEMGFNEKGLMIGNEAEGSRMKPEEEEGILGMDLLRLALERCATVQEAIALLTGLLEQYGQKANASALTYRTYENTFILADRKEAWVLETAGRQWAAKKIRAFQGISNCYSIGKDMDMVSERAEDIARENRWLSPEEPFHFAKAYSGRLVNQPLGIQRYRRLNKLLGKQSMHDFQSLSAILRDHHEDELIYPRFGATCGTFLSICMHMRDFGESETVASLLCRYDEELGVVAAYAPGQPCLSVYLPVYMTGQLPAAMQTADQKYDPKSLWWQMKELSLLVAVDEEKFAPVIRSGLEAMEERFRMKAKTVEAQAVNLIRAKRHQDAKEMLNQLMETCVKELSAYAEEWNREMLQVIRIWRIVRKTKEAIEKYAEYAGISHFLHN